MGQLLSLEKKDTCVFEREREREKVITTIRRKEPLSAQVELQFRQRTFLCYTS